MSFSAEQTNQLHQECRSVLNDLQELQLNVVEQGQPLETTSKIREHLLHGAGRRIGIVRRSIENIFSFFPPETTRPLQSDTLADVQINLHAFVLNLYGIYDNWAWSFVLKHDLESVIGNRLNIGLFKNETQKYLPESLRGYLSSQVTIDWHKKYAKTFRDALAHRIPPYIPPAQFTHDEGRLYNSLETEKLECLKNRRLERLEEIWSEQADIGTPCFMFLHAYTEDTPPTPILLHPQILCDAKAVVEFGLLFLQHWHQRA